MGVKISVSYRNQTWGTQWESYSQASYKYNGVTAYLPHIGSKTFECAGKLMHTDFVFGGVHTLACAGKIMRDNVTMTSEDYVYTWKKYNTVATPIYGYYLAETKDRVRLYNTDNARFIEDPGTPVITVADGVAKFDWRNAGHQKVNGSNWEGKWFSGWDDGVVRTQDDWENITFTNTAIRLSDRRLGIVTYNFFDNAVYKIHQTGTNYSAGSYINDVTSTDPNAHPVNGRDPNDGYYYIRQ